MSTEPGIAQPPAGLPKRVRRQVAWTWWVLLWERLWPVLAATLSVLALGAALALTGLPARLPVWAHAGLLAVVALAAGAVLIGGLARLRRPTWAAALRRLEQANGLSHQPLTALTDRPAAGDSAAAEAIWRRHLARALRATRHLRRPRPQPGLAARDPYALRYGVLLVLVVAAVAAGARGPDRLAHALAPGSLLPAAEPPHVDAWITAPDYTGEPPVVLVQAEQARGAGEDQPSAAPTGSGERARPQDAITVPAGSELTLRVHGGRGAAQASLGGEPLALSALAEGGQEVTHALAASGSKRLVLRQNGRTLGDWALTVRGDAPPELAFARPPEAGPDGTLVLRYTATDRYGIDSVRAVIERPDSPDTPFTEAPVTRDLRIPRSETDSAEAHLHLAGHPWAGQRVRLYLRAQDAAGQTARTEPIDLRLPTRSFDHPVAQAIIGARRDLVAAPGETDAVAQQVRRVAADSAAYRHDRTVFVALSAAAHRLAYRGDSPAALRATAQLLWDTAVRLEDGGLSRARAELRDLEAAFADALADEADREAMAEILEQMEAELARFLESLQRQLAQRLDPEGNGDSARALEMARRAENLIQERLDAVREALAAGDRAGAEAAMAELSELLDQLRAGEVRQAGETAAGEMARALEELVAEQDTLMSDTGEHTGDAGAADDPAGADDAGTASGEASDLAELGRRQGDLRERLAGIAEQLDQTIDTPEALSGAGDAMERARQALADGDAARATQAQAEALDRLAEGARDAMGRMAESTMSQALGLSPGRGGNGPPRRDPLGRSRPGGTAPGDVDVPDETEPRRAREILNLLRERVSDPARPAGERDYLQRLLERF